MILTNSSGFLGGCPTIAAVINLRVEHRLERPPVSPIQACQLYHCALKRLFAMTHFWNVPYEQDCYRNDDCKND